MHKHSISTLKSAKFQKIHLEMECVYLRQLLKLKTLMVGHGGSTVGSYIADPTSPTLSHRAVIIPFKSVPVINCCDLYFKH